jgi:prepilin-type processing-associated H-X9-DG protein
VGAGLSAAAAGGRYVKITQIRRSSATIQFVELTRFGEFAGADHPHVELWTGSNRPARAAQHVQISGPRPEPQAAPASRANYGFLDGHAETLRFEEVFQSFNLNKFDPAIAQ